MSAGVAFSRLGEVAREVVAAAVAPAAVAGAARYSGRWEDAFGFAGALWPRGLAPDPPAVGLDTVFDLASLTKPVTALTLARLERAGVIGKAETLGDVLKGEIPAISRTASANVPLELLLAHRAGLLAHNPFYQALLEGRRPSKSEVLLAAADLRRDGCEGRVPPDGFPPVYSDLGYLLVGAAIEARTGMPLDRLMAREVVASLGLESKECLGSARQLREDGVALRRIAPTEVVEWRGGLIRGVVHDENAWLIAGDSAAGHAGLFGTCGAVVALGQLVLDAVLGRSSWLDADEIGALIRARPGGSHAAGFDRRATAPGVVPSSGARFSPDTFGHLGFTGTSIWLDPLHEVCAVLLTNRVCPSRDHVAIRTARPIAYDAMFEAMTTGGR